MNLSDLISLAKNGYTISDIKELVELSKQPEEKKKEVEESKSDESENEESGSQAEEEESKEEEVKEESEKDKKIKELQEMLKNKDISNDEKIQTSTEILSDLFKDL